MIARSRNSVNISFAQMLAYIDNIIEMPDNKRLSLVETINRSDMPGDVKSLVIDKISGLVMPKDEKDLIVEKIRLKELLRLLDNESFRKLHNSVDNFFTEMPNVIDKIGDLKNLTDSRHAFIKTFKQFKSAKSEILFKDMPDDVKKQLEDKIWDTDLPKDITYLLVDQIIGSHMPEDITNLLIDRIQRVDMSEDVICLLKTYRNMADKFYTQYEDSLLEKIKEQNLLQEQSSWVIEYINRLEETDPKKTELKIMIPLLEKARGDAVTEFDNLTANFPTLLQNALDKLKDEWQRLNTIAVASQTLTEDKNLIQALDAVVTATSYSVGIEAERIAVVPGNAFALYFFTYLENFAVLTVPIYSVRAPWEWSIFWHELAGYRVRQLKNGATIDSIRKYLSDFHDHYKKISDAKKRDDLLDAVTRNNVYDTNDSKQENDSLKADLQKRKNKYSRKYLVELFSRNELDFKDLGSFEHQFEQLLENLPKEDKFQAYDKLKVDGWCVDWFEELFEDAWSVIAIREPFLDFFKDILNRHKGTDGRHPTPDVRLRVAGEMLKLMNSEDELKPPMSVEESTAQQILKFMSLLSAASYQSGKLDDDLHNRMRYEFRNFLAESVGIRIGNSISHWSSEYLEAGNRVGNAMEEAEKIINVLSAKELHDFISGLASTTDERYQLDTTYYKKLLNGRDYKELLALPFYDVDFNVGLIETYEFTHNGTYHITSDKLTTAIQNNWIKKQNPNNTHWYQIALHKTDKNGTKLPDDYWTTDTHTTDMQTMGKSLITKIS